MVASRLQIVYREYTELGYAKQSSIVGQENFAASNECCCNLQGIGRPKSILSPKISCLLRDHGINVDYGEVATAKEQLSVLTLQRDVSELPWTGEYFSKRDR
jgi:hypothetical protein